MMTGLKIGCERCEREKSAEREGAPGERRGGSTQAAFAESIDLVITTTVTVQSSTHTLG